MYQIKYIDRMTLSSLFFFIGLVLGLVNGLLLGIIMLIHRMSGDLGNIFSLALKQSQVVLTDMQSLKARAGQKNLQLPKVSEIFYGVLYIVILPGVLQIIEQKIPLVGGLVSATVTRFFGAVFKGVERRLSASSQKDIATRESSDKPVAATQEQLQEYCDKGIRAVEGLQGIISKIIGTTVRIATLPFKLFLLISSIASLTVLGVIILTLI